MKKKIITIIILCMFLLTSLTTLLAVGMESAGGNTIYVDDDADPEWYDETHVKTIKEGINAAQDGDTVYVYSGIYYEHFSVGKSIWIRGENKLTTIIDAEKKSCVIDLPALPENGVTISGFTIRNSSSGNDGISSGMYSSNNIIFGNIITNNRYGIILRGGSYNKIYDNEISYNDKGIELSGAPNTEIYGNTLIWNEIIALGIGSSINCVIHHNNLISTDNCYSHQNSNQWDDGSEGNYWASFYDVDENGDGIWDHTKGIGGLAGNKDRYPLTKAYGIDNNPPDAGPLDGSSSGNVGTEYTFTFQATDPDGDDVKYYIDWDDDNTEWTGYYDSGEEAKVKHTWVKQDNYLIKAKARDIYGYESGWALLEVTMPRNKAINTPLFNFLQQHPILYQLLQRFLNI